MRFSGIALLSFILTSGIVVTAAPGKKSSRIDLRPSNMYAKCGTSEYRSEELDEAAKEACKRMVSKGKFLGISLKSLPKTYDGNLVISYDEASQSPHNPYHHHTHVFHPADQRPIMWPLKRKFIHLKAECYAIIQWTPERARCKTIAVIMQEDGRPDVKCNQQNHRDSNSRHAGSSIYHPENPSPIYPGNPISQSAGSSSPYRAGSSSPYRAGGFSPYRAGGFSPYRAGGSSPYRG